MNTTPQQGADAEIPTWQERCNWVSKPRVNPSMLSAMQAEIADLRAALAASVTAQVGAITRNATDAEIAAWVERYDLAGILGNSARAAFEDAESLHQTYAAPAPITPASDDEVAALRAYLDLHKVPTAVEQNGVPLALSLLGRVAWLMNTTPASPAASGEATPEIDALMAKWDDDGATRGAAFIELRDKARQMERCFHIAVEECRRLATSAAAQASTDAKDAARYRWLRDKKMNVSQVIDKQTDWVPPDETVPGVGGYWLYEYRAVEDLDSAIDAAMQSTAPAAPDTKGAAS